MQRNPDKIAKAQNQKQHKSYTTISSSSEMAEFRELRTLLFIGPDDPEARYQK